MFMVKAFFTLLLTIEIGGISAFITPTTVRSSSSASALWYKDGDAPRADTWKATNDFPTFLNQISVQSFLFVLGSLRDPHTVKWVDKFTQPVFPDTDRKSTRLTGTTEATTAMTTDQSISNPNGKSSTRLLIYHGLGCMNTTAFPTWNSYFEQLLDRPLEGYIIQSHNGLSREYEMEINPASLCTRIISVRERIAFEMENDLRIVAQMGAHTMDSYWEYWDDQITKAGDGDNQGQDNTPNTGHKEDHVTMSSGADVRRRLPPHNLAFLDYSLASLGDMKSSPLRKGNFDLVVLLATQESICRILNNRQQEDLKHEQRVYQQFLQEFYTERLESHFTGIQRYGRADDFLEELLFSTGTALVDPVRLAEIILREREQVALEWQAMSQDIPNDHFVIKRLQLDRLMESYNMP